MSISLMSLIFYIDPDQCDTHEKAVLLALGDHANDEGEGAYPSQDRLAWKCSMTVRGVQKVLARLYDKRLVFKVNAGGGSEPNEYKLNVDEIESVSCNPRSAPWKNKQQQQPGSNTPEPGSPLNTVQGYSRTPFVYTPEPRSSDPSLNHQSKPSRNETRSEPEEEVEEIVYEECDDEGLPVKPRNERPKWQIPEDHPYLKRAMASCRQMFFTKREQRVQWKVVRTSLQANLLSKDWIEHCLDYAEHKPMPLLNLLKWMSNVDKMRVWELETQSSRQSENQSDPVPPTVNSGQRLAIKPEALEKLREMGIE